MKKVLILGASGLVGKAFINECSDVFELYGTYFSKGSTLPENKQFQLEVKDTEKIKELIQNIKPNYVISCLRGDFNEQLEFHRVLADELKDLQSRVYYFSTANVYDGDYSKHHTEKDQPVAQSDYGKFKIACEEILQSTLQERAIIIRIPMMWGTDSPRLNHLKESLANKDSVDVYTNLELNNLMDTMLAKQLRYIMENDLKGIFHLASEDMITHAEFIEELLKMNQDATLRHHLFLDKEVKAYFGIRSVLQDFPDELKQTNQEIIENLRERLSPHGLFRITQN
ncbi:sugar nucleotide-binding protein [Peribacillus alkalitolerans]|uniref:sugar nucleotide-binding protein n=1 Tax=Peribacillus alkalitolerans TaxID=1550385 RepID=UPI0013CFDE97|nr:sugar nucleotide-binding protein [Peribacillus alkalitolerans]